MSRKRDDLRTLPRHHWDRQVHGRAVVCLTCPTLSPMNGRLTHELENAASTAVPLFVWNDFGQTRFGSASYEWSGHRGWQLVNSDSKKRESMNWHAERGQITYQTDNSGVKGQFICPVSSKLTKSVDLVVALARAFVPYELRPVDHFVTRALRTVHSRAGH
jgi:hypothetical protein